MHIREAGCVRACGTSSPRSCAVFACTRCAASCACRPAFQLVELKNLEKAHVAELERIISERVVALAKEGVPFIFQVRVGHAPCGLPLA
ncbi:hypothetical protein EON67_04610 [archaeon]|nr:MAG: hypothetical protein EON67_04610 [archaeon]